MKHLLGDAATEKKAEREDTHLDTLELGALEQYYLTEEDRKARELMALKDEFTRRVDDLEALEARLTEGLNAVQALETRLKQALDDLESGEHGVAKSD